MNLMDIITACPKVKILTITLNPVLDRTLYINNFQLGKTLVAENVKNYAGGKGVNVSRALITLGTRTIAAGIIPEKGSELYTSILDDENIPHSFLKVPGYLRINTTIISGVSSAETHIREKGSIISVEKKDTFLQTIERLIPGFHGVSLSGSIPQGLDISIYKDIIQFAAKKGLRTYLDTSGSPLREGIKARPLLIKPNLDEARELTGVNPKKMDDLISIIKKIHQMGITHVVLSLGKDGLLLSSGKKCYHGRCLVKNITNTVGSGDATLAGAILGVELKLPEKDTTALSASMGAANTQSDGACHFGVNDIKTMLNKVRIKEVPL